MSSPVPLNVGMIGGGVGSFIASPHQKAIHFDGTRRVTSVALRSDPEAAMTEAAEWPYPVKGYETYDAMIAAQADLPADERIDYILIVTPNSVHFDPVMKALDAGIPVGVGRYLAAGQVRLLHQDIHLLGGVLLDAHCVPLSQDAAGGARGQDVRVLLQDCLGRYDPCAVSLCDGSGPLVVQIAQGHTRAQPS